MAVDAAFDARSATQTLKEQIATPPAEIEKRVRMARAQAAYKAYGDATEWKTYAGKPMMQFHELPAHILRAWIASAEAAAAYR
jgi:hypothetical protein